MTFLSLINVKNMHAQLDEWEAWKTDAKRYTITWYTNVIKVGRSVLALGICEKTKSVSFIAPYRPNTPIGPEFLKIFTIQDIYAKGTCEDDRVCLNLDCPLCKPDYHHWKKYKVETRRDLQLLHEQMEQAKKELNLTIAEHGKQIHFENTPLEITTEKRRKK
jgi:hypothetical protein